MESGARDARGREGDATGGSTQEVPWKGVSSVYLTTTRAPDTQAEARVLREELLQLPGVDFFSG